MKCSLPVGLSVFCVFLVVCVLVILLNQASCPLGTFRCENTSICLPRRYLCDGHFDCPNGTDENRLSCADYHGELDSIADVLQRPNFTRTSPTYNTCNLVGYPSGCICKNSTWLFCNGMGLTTIPQVSPTLSKLVLANNNITRISAADFQRYDLHFLHLEGNAIEEIPSTTFHQQTNLTKLFLMRNKLRRLSNNTFQGLSKLVWLFLQDNQLQDLTLNSFQPLTSIDWLDLSINKLKLKGQKFPWLPTLEDLMIEDNLIEEITSETFSQLPNLIYLRLRSNLIHTIAEDSFVSLRKLQVLDLSRNNLEYIPDKLFQSQQKLSKLLLGHNPIKVLGNGVFSYLVSLKSLQLEEIDIQSISVEMFAHSNHLDFVYFKRFQYCRYVPHAVKCRPTSDGVSSFSEMLAQPILRICLWLVAGLTALGNLVVLASRGLARSENRVLAQFVQNLAVADLCMGVYLFIIGERDLQFRGEFNAHANRWMNSWTCSFLGILVVTASEVSLMLLAFMSLERFLSIATPFGERKLTPKTSLICIGLIWATGLLLALIPVLFWQESSHYYGNNALCFPLHMDEPHALGWQYSTFLYIGINCTCVLLIGVVYSGLFISIRRTRLATPLAVNEIEVAVRFFFIVFTDCLCWTPIIILKILAISHYYISEELYAWVVIFVLPVNSAINPFLYTFTTPTFRSLLRDAVHRIPSLKKFSGVGSRLSVEYHPTTLLAHLHQLRTRIRFLSRNSRNSEIETELTPVSTAATLRNNSQISESVGANQGYLASRKSSAETHNI